MDFFTFEGTVAINTRQEVSNMVSNGTFKSSFRQVRDLVNSGEFRLDNNILSTYYDIEQQASQNKTNGIGDANGYTPELYDAYSTFEKAAVTDYYNEQFKLRNGSDYYARDTRGQVKATQQDVDNGLAGEVGEMIDNRNFGR